MNNLIHQVIISYGCNFASNYGVLTLPLPPPSSMIIKERHLQSTSRHWVPFNNMTWKMFIHYFFLLPCTTICSFSDICCTNCKIMHITTFFPAENMLFDIIKKPCDMTTFAFFFFPFLSYYEISFATIYKIVLKLVFISWKTDICYQTLQNN